jgi:NADH-quinone oxidoreductase subunit N
MEWLLPDISLKVISPEIILLVFGLLILILEPLLKGNKKSFLPHLSWIGVILSLVMVLRLWDMERSSFHRMVVSDNFSSFFSIIFLLGTFLVILSSVGYLKKESMLQGEYFSLILFSTIGMMLMASSLNLIVIFLGLEVMSVSLYILAGFRKTDLKSNESSMKYFLIGAFASGFLLYGIALIYGVTRTVNLEELLVIFSSTGFEKPILLFIGIGLLIVGFGFKIAVVPFQMWVPDVYQGAPTPITAFISSGPKAAGFAALLRVFVFGLGNLKPDWTAILWILAALTMTMGNVIAISQTNIKRLLAYSSIAHAGYILVALIAGGYSGVSSAMFYLLAYVFMNIGAFIVVISLGENRTDLDDYSGLGWKYPWLGVFMTIFMLSLAGFPPTAGFMAKFYVFSAAVKSGYVGLVIIAVLNSFVSVYYYLRVMVVMFMRTSSSNIEPVSFPYLWSLALLLCISGTLLLGIFPQNFLLLAQNSVFSVF